MQLNTPEVCLQVWVWKSEIPPRMNPGGNYMAAAFLYSAWQLPIEKKKSDSRNLPSA